MVHTIYEEVKNKKVSVEQLIKLASDLKSEHSENNEYDRALTELICDAAGLSMDHTDYIAGLIGIDH